MKLKNNNQGISAILTVVIISASALIIAYSATFLGLGNLDKAVIFESGEKSRYFLDTCAEEALEKVRKNNSYTGETLNLNGNSCIINIIGTGSTLTILISGSIGDYYKNLEVVVDISGNNLEINEWKEY